MGEGIRPGREVAVFGLGEPGKVRLQRRQRHLGVDGRARVEGPALQLLRVHDVRRRLRLLPLEGEEPVRDQQAPHRLGRMRRPQPEHRHVAVGLARHLPDGLGPPLVGRDGLARAGRRVEAREVEDPVLQRTDAGRDGGPDERRERGHE
jgi:hypothetical protein